MKKRLIAALLAVGILLAPATFDIAATDDDPGHPQSVENDIS